MKTRSLLFLSVFLASAVFGQAPDTLRILFIGNSLTYFNNLPWLVDSLAMSAGKKAIVDMRAVGGANLLGHRSDSITLYMIEHGPWDYIVLQEQSEFPIVDTSRWHGFYPACLSFDSLIRSHGATTALFMTWAWKCGGTHTVWGDTSIHFVDYFQEQDSVAASYEWIAWDIVYDTLVPVGLAWRLAKTEDSIAADLWQPDNNHPTMKGSYLSACVFYTKLFQASPIGLPYNAGLDPALALWLQTIAYRTIYGAEETPAREPAWRGLTIMPNPFRQSTRISKGQSTEGMELNIYDIKGSLIRSFTLGPMPYALSWDGSDRSGRAVPPGIYFIRLQAGGQTETVKVVKLQ